MKISLQDIAERAGVSVATVSRALRHHPRIPAATTERIHRIAAEMGYVPDARMKELMAHMRAGRQQKDRPVLACILDIALPLPRGWEQLGGWRFLTGAIEQAQQLGYRLELFSLCEPGLSHQRLSSILYHRGINGVLIGPMADPTIQLSIRWDHFATVAIGHSLAAPHLHRVSSDQLHTTRLCYTKARELGYQRIGLAITEKADRRTIANLRGGYLIEQSLDQGDTGLPIFVLRQGENGERFGQWLRQEKPDAIIYSGTGLCVPEWTAEAGLRCPENIGLIIAGLTPEAEETGVCQMMQNVGAAAVDLLVSEIYGNQRGIPSAPKLVLLEGVWREGSTARRLTSPRSSQ